MDPEKESVWDYDLICTKLKRWSFESKMRIAYDEAIQFADLYSAKHNVSLADYPQLDEIETFVLLAVKHEEWQFGKISLHEFRKIIEGIRAFKHPEMMKHEGEDFSRWWFPTAGVTQFYNQKDPIYRLVRYAEYFSHADEYINMEKEIVDKFGLKYEDIMGPVSLLWMSIIPNSLIRIIPNLIPWLYKQYKESFDLITVSRQKYIEELDGITNRKEDYRYCLRPSYLWPFISFEGKRCLPTPHLLIPSVTESLMHRLTEGNNKLRQKIGLRVLEPYLYRIVKKSNKFDEVLSEQEYQPGQRTLDVITRIGNDILCFDSKSLTPSISIRTFSTDAYKATLNKLVEAVKQAYHQIQNKYWYEHPFLSIPVKQDLSNIFAIVVVAEDPMILPNDIYSEAAAKLGIENPSTEYDWMRGHIGITELSLLEIQLFDRDGMMEAVRHNSETQDYSAYWFVQGRTNAEEDVPDFVAKRLYELWNPIERKAASQGIRLLTTDF